MSDKRLPRLGIIEGFYGVAWSHKERLAMLDFLAAKAFSSYCYAPKSDHYLRNNWQQPWGRVEFEALEHLSDHARNNGVDFSVGLTPLELHKHWRSGSSERRALKHKLAQIKALNPAGISILFDDMWGSDENLAAMQIDMSHFIADELGLTQVCVCPSYYSFDPLLEELFGAKPKNYWQQLGGGLDVAIDLYWTGDTVITENYGLHGLRAITEHFRRKPVIWDNSRVNDGRKTSPFLPLKAMPDITLLAEECAGFVVNPMNAAHLAQLVLTTLFVSGPSDARLQHALQQLGKDFCADLSLLLPLLTEVGLDALSDADRQGILAFVKRHDNVYSHDIAQWLQGKFVFDPACLT